MNHTTRRGPRAPAKPWQAHALAAALTLLAYAERLFLARIVVELLLHLAQITG